MWIHKHHIHESTFIQGLHAGIPSAIVPHLSLLTRLSCMARARQNPPSSTARRLELPVPLPTLGLSGNREESSRMPGGSAGAGPGGGNAEPGTGGTGDTSSRGTAPCPHQSSWQLQRALICCMHFGMAKLQMVTSPPAVWLNQLTALDSTTPP